MIDSLSFSERLRDENRAAWEQAVDHRFTREAGDDTIEADVYAHYLIQDYQFIESLVNMVAYGIAKAPDMPAKNRLSGFLAALTSDENTYFMRSFDALGIKPRRYTKPTLHRVSAAFIEVLSEVGEQGSYDEIIATLLPAEWIYLEWCARQQHKTPSRFYLSEWIAIHTTQDFRDFVMWLKQELDTRASQLQATERATLAARFERMVELEVAFFDAAYAA